MFSDGKLRHYVVGALVAVLVIIGLFVFFPQAMNIVNHRSSSEKDYSSQAPGKIISAPITDRTALKGMIVKIQGNSLFVETGPAYPGASPSLNEREVTVSQNTTLQKEDGFRNDPNYAQELKDFNNKMSALEAAGSSTAGMQAPSAYKYTNIDFSAFKIGQYVVIISDKNIADSKVITPNYVLIQNYVASGG